jgi:acetyltransferase
MEAKNPADFCDLLNLYNYREEWTGKDGRTVVLRLITHKDKRLEKELVNGLSRDSSRYRFLHVIKEATEEMVDQLCDIDCINEIAIMAEYDSNGKKQSAGAARIFIEPNLQTAEFAMLVADDFQGIGLGTKFMTMLIDIGRKIGLKSIYGTVLKGNDKMLTLAKKFDFVVGDISFGEVRIVKQL